MIPILCAGDVPDWLFNFKSINAFDVVDPHHDLPLITNHDHDQPNNVFEEAGA